MTGQRKAGIVVGVDGSAPAFGAVEWAAREAELRGLPVRLLAVLPDEVTPRDDEGARRRARDVLDTAERVARGRAPAGGGRGGGPARPPGAPGGGGGGAAPPP
ncbi:universal stress protein, partial [Saccharopolyspora sp. 6T]|uniref:universal stress protein n=1 Tax=Saccharopolyspora sp. 6T TaxID=2877238 RepID=UPI001CD2622B